MPTAEAVPDLSLSHPAFKAELQRLRQTDNVTNWYYVARTYLYLVAVIAPAVVVFEAARVGDLHWLWAVPAAVISIVLVGAGQHQLSGLAHEGVHHILFRNRYLNDLASDLLTMFPVFGATHLYRLQHLAHHQFVNDPDRDPDVSQLIASGHWQNFPLAAREFVRNLVKQLWVPNLVRFMRVRAKYNGTGTDKNPYVRPGQKPARTAVRIGLAYMLSLVVSLIVLYRHGDPVVLVAVPFGMWAAVSLVFWRLPANRYIQTRLHPVVPARYMTILRVGYITTVFTTLAAVMLLTAAPAPLYYIVLWIVPMLTSFAFFMILRQLVQHGNADRGWVTNTRTFLVGRAINFAVFPMGQDFHLSHHMYATIPHYRLRSLHELMMRCPEYRTQGVVVKGYFFPTEYPKTAPTVLDVLGPDFAAKTADVHIDNTVLDDDKFDDPDQIRDSGERLRSAS
ncbi:MAG: fatty acid desaturase family protein [Fimbriiglobus sp.]